MSIRIHADTELGTHVETSAFVGPYGGETSDQPKLEMLVEAQKGAKVGQGCRVSSHIFIC